MRILSLRTHYSLFIKRKDSEFILTNLLLEEEKNICEVKSIFMKTIQDISNFFIKFASARTKEVPTLSIRKITSRRAFFVSNPK